jgi:hypothetical protein
MEEMTMPEIAEAIGVPVNTAHSMLRAACQEFDESVDALVRGRRHGRDGAAPVAFLRPVGVPNVQERMHGGSGSDDDVGGATT